MKRVCGLCLLLLFLAGAALAEPVTLRTASTFAGGDAAASTYAELLKRWEEETGNILADDSATSDEAWKTGVLKDFAAGNEADVLFFFAKTADSEAILKKVVPIAEINAAYPDAHLTVDESMKEADGQTYAIPVRPFWEGLLCNADLFAQYGLPLPTDWESFRAAILTFRRHGIVPIAVSLSDVPHYLAEFAIISSGSLEEQEKRPVDGQEAPASWVEGMALIRELYQLGAFSDDVNATTMAAASQLFTDKKAAMQIDGSWFANSLPARNMDSTVVLPFPAKSESAAPAYVYGVSMGFYLTRAAWRDEDRRDAAVHLLRYLTSGENARALGAYEISGWLLQSSQEMLDGSALRCAPIQDDMNPDARGLWFSLIPSVAKGELSPEALWERVMAMRPFEK